MMRAPTLADINAAESRVAHYKRNTRDSLQRANGALHATIERATAMTLIAGAAGLFIFWRVQRKQRETSLVSHEQGLAPPRSTGGVMLGFILRYGVQGLSFALQRIQAAWQNRAGRPAEQTGADYR